MRLKLANAPTSWGIERPSDDSYPSWRRVMDEIAQAGYEGTELGPYGYLPTDAPALRSELASRGLRLTAGTVMQPFHIAEEMQRTLQLSEDICRLLSTQGAPYLVLIPAIVPEREATAGRSESAPRLGRAGFHRSRPGQR